jgi:hypothetical protein
MLFRVVHCHQPLQLLQGAYGCFFIIAHSHVNADGALTIM